MNTTTQGLNRKGMTDHTAGTFDPEYGYWQVVGFDEIEMAVLVRKINAWHQDHPEFNIIKVHYSSAGAEAIWYSALVEFNRVAP